MRHFYDIHQLLKTPEVKKLMGSDLLVNRFRDVLYSDLNNPEFENSWSVNLLKEVPLFKNLDIVFANLEDSFENHFKNILYDDENILWEDVKDSFKILSKIIPDIKIPPA